MTMLEEGRKPLDVYPVWKNLKWLEDWIKKGRENVPWPRLLNASDATLKYSGPLAVSSFPRPFPTLPFSYRARRMKAFIPFQALPTKITVHDPWNLLAMSATNMYGTSNISAPGNKDDWKHVEDRVHTYRLKIQDEGMQEMYHRCDNVTEQQTRCVEDLMKTMEGIWKSDDAGEFRVVWTKEDASDAKYYFKGAPIQLQTGDLLFPPTFPDDPTDSESGTSSNSITVEPPIYLIHYPPPPPPTQSKVKPQANLSGIRPLGESTHVYFYPRKDAGSGHHSRAYKVEWEVPRTSIFPESEDGETLKDQDEVAKGKRNDQGEDYVLCEGCIQEDIERQLVELLSADWDMEARWKVVSGQLARTEVPATDPKHDVTNTIHGASLKLAENPQASGVKGENTGEEPRVETPSSEGSVATPRSSRPDSPASGASDASCASNPKTKPNYVYTYTGPLRPILITTRYQDRLRPTCLHLDPLSKFMETPEHRDPEDMDGQPELQTTPSSSSSSSTAPPPTTKLRALAKLAYPSSHVSSCSHGDCNETSADHQELLKNEARCYEQFGICDEGRGLEMYTHWGKKMDPDAEEGDEGDIELGAIVPRFYGYWVHDEECSCEGKPPPEVKPEEGRNAEETSATEPGPEGEDGRNEEAGEDEEHAAVTEDGGEAIAVESEVPTSTDEMMVTRDGQATVDVVMADSNEEAPDEEKDDGDEAMEVTMAEPPNELVVKDKKKDKGYFSDILLLENCGWPVHGTSLRDDEKETIQNIYRRFHNYGWTHGTPSHKRVLYHWGPVNRAMGGRSTDKEKRVLSFRLTNFGKSTYHDGCMNGEGEAKQKWEGETSKEMDHVLSKFSVEKVVESPAQTDTPTEEPEDAGTVEPGMEVVEAAQTVLADTGSAEPQTEVEGTAEAGVADVVAEPEMEVAEVVETVIVEVAETVAADVRGPHE